MKIKLYFFILLIVFINGCVGTSSKGVFGTGVSIALDPRTLGTQIDDSIMDKNLDGRLLKMNKSYFLSVKTKVLDGRIFITGKVDNPEEKLKITKLAWETKGVRSVRNDIKIKEKFNFKFDGDMQPDVALDEEYKELYPFSEIVGNANVLVMPGQHSAAITYKTMKTLGGSKVIGPLLIGLGQAIEIAPLRSSTSDILNLASVAAYSAGVINYNKKN